MALFNTILVPTDFSEPSKKALTYGLTLSDHLRAKLIIAHVVAGTDRLDRDLENTLRRDIYSLVPADHPRRSNIHVIIRAGRIEAELLHIVSAEDVDLVVMGTHGRRNATRWFIGSVTEHLLRRVPVPLVTLSHPEEEQHTVGVARLKRILYATDRSESSQAGLRYALELARATGAQLTMMHAVYYVDGRLWAPAGIPGFEEHQLRIRGEMEKTADEVRIAEGARHVHIETLVVEGKPFEKILEVAQERAMDIIVLNLQSKSTLDRAFLGSTAERVVRLAHIPVLSIPLTTSREIVEQSSSVVSQK